jgi:hypothetical protein
MVKSPGHGDSILKVRSILAKAVQWQLFDGNVSIWYDRMSLGFQVRNIFIIII